MAPSGRRAQPQTPTALAPSPTWTKRRTGNKTPGLLLYGTGVGGKQTTETNRHPFNFYWILHAPERGTSLHCPNHQREPNIQLCHASKFDSAGSSSDEGNITQPGFQMQGAGIPTLISVQACRIRIFPQKFVLHFLLFGMSMHLFLIFTVAFARNQSPTAIFLLCSRRNGNLHNTAKLLTSWEPFAGSP